MNKPLCLELEEATNELNQAIEQISARHGLPCYLLTYLVSDVLTRLQNGKRTELETARRSLAERSENNVEQRCDNS